MSPATKKPVTSAIKVNKPFKYNKKKLMKYMHRAHKFAHYLEFFNDLSAAEGKELIGKDGEETTSNGIEKPSEVKKRPVLDVTKRLRGLREIEEKLNEIKGKKMANIVEIRYKKNLKTRLTKHQKKEKKKLEKGLKNKTKNKLINWDSKKTLPNDGEQSKPEKNVEKVIFNKEDKMVFNKIDFSGIGKGKSKSTKNLDKDPKLLLDELKKTESKLNELEKSGDVSKAKEMREKQMWTSALKKAEGVKVKDDPNLLKKTMRKQKEVKNRRQRKWENRVNVIEKKKEDRQKKRQENIAAKKQERKKKKIKQSVKKGRIVL